jgi:Predicted transcriptional regulators
MKRRAGMLLKIQDFADFCGLSVRALHLYDKIGLFVPNMIDENNRYRYYDTEQMLELNTILSFKKVGFSLNDIKELKSKNFSKEIVIEKLQEIKKQNQLQIEISSYNNKIIENMLSDINNHDSKAEVDEKYLTQIICMENDKLESFFSQILWL